jgi:hypothetical protein
MAPVAIFGFSMATGNTGENCGEWVMGGVLVEAQPLNANAETRPSAP